MYSMEAVWKLEADQVGASHARTSYEFVGKFLGSQVICKNWALMNVWLPILNSRAGDLWESAGLY